MQFAHLYTISNNTDRFSAPQTGRMPEMLFHIHIVPGLKE